MVRSLVFITASLWMSINSIHAFLSCNTQPQKPSFPRQQQQPNTMRFMSSFAADGSEYSSQASDYDDEEIAQKMQYTDEYSDQDEVATVEEKPVPMSKNAGNRFVAIVWDQDVDTQNRDAMTLHEDRDELVEDHVMFCRKQNLYNETFNSDSMVDILKSLPM